jgi:hypothetical protein
MDSHLRDAITNRLTVAKVSLSCRSDSSNYAGFGDGIAQLAEPCIELCSAKKSGHGALYPKGYGCVKALERCPPDLTLELSGQINREAIDWSA